jgi:hypothetical protein
MEENHPMQLFLVLICVPYRSYSYSAADFSCTRGPSKLEEFEVFRMEEIGKANT